MPDTNLREVSQSRRRQNLLIYPTVSRHKNWVADTKTSSLVGWRRFLKQQLPSRGLLRDCKNVAKVRYKLYTGHRVKLATLTFRTVYQQQQRAIDNTILGVEMRIYRLLVNLGSSATSPHCLPTGSMRPRSHWARYHHRYRSYTQIFLLK